MLALPLAIATCALVLLPRAGAFGPPTQKKLNVLFLVADDFRYQLGTAGPGVAGPGCPLEEGPGCTKMHTPNIDALAAESLFMEKNYVQQAICAVSRTSILTGRRPDSTQVWDLHSYWRDQTRGVAGRNNFTTIPQYFKEHGYESVGVGKIFHPGYSSGLKSSSANASLARDKGACPWQGRSTGACSDDQLFSWSRPYFHSPNAEGSPDGGFGDLGGKAWTAVDEADAMNLADAQVAQHAVETLKGFQASNLAKPFFLAVGFHRPHLPFIVPQSKLDLYPVEDILLPADQAPPAGMPDIAWSSSGELVAYADIKLIRNGSAFKPGDVLPPSVVKDLRRGYYAAVSHMDDQVGLVVDALKQSPYADNTIVSFWGDHGWQLGEHGEWCKHTNFELATRAPMFIKVPGTTDKEAVYYSKTVTWGTQAESNCAWQCSCHSSQYGCGSMDKCARYTFDGATHLCQLFVSMRTAAFTEHVDLFPTLAELAMGVALPRCPDGTAQLDTKLCTMGKSLVPLMHSLLPGRNGRPSDPLRPSEVSNASFMQYPRRSEMVKRSTCLDKPCIMGYSIVTRLAGDEYRYTEWVDFNTVVFRGPDWGSSKGAELYSHDLGDLGENNNMCGPGPTCDAPQRLQGVVTELQALLHRGPLTGGGWGPWA